MRLPKTYTILPSNSPEAVDTGHKIPGGLLQPEIEIGGGKTTTTTTTTTNPDGSKTATKVVVKEGRTVKMGKEDYGAIIIGLLVLAGFLTHVLDITYTIGLIGAIFLGWGGLSASNTSKQSQANQATLNKQLGK